MHPENLRNDDRVVDLCKNALEQAKPSHGASQHALTDLFQVLKPPDHAKALQSFNNIRSHKLLARPLNLSYGNHLLERRYAFIARFLHDEGNSQI